MRLPVAALLLLVGAGCGTMEPSGASHPSSATTQSTQQTDQTEPRGGDDHSFGLMFASDESVDAKPLRELYSVFFSPATAEDRPAAAWAANQDIHPGARPPTNPPTEPTFIEARARLLLRDAGLAGEDLVGAPQTDGHVCVALVPTGSGGCGQGFGPHGVQINGETRGPKMVLYGLVGDEVRGVEVVAAGMVHRAQMGRNSFALTLDKTSEDELDRMILFLKDGAKNSVDLGGG